MLNLNLEDCYNLSRESERRLNWVNIHLDTAIDILSARFSKKSYNSTILLGKNLKKIVLAYRKLLGNDGVYAWIKNILEAMDNETHKNARYKLFIEITYKVTLLIVILNSLNKIHRKLSKSLDLIKRNLGKQIREDVQCVSDAYINQLSNLNLSCVSQLSQASTERLDRGFNSSVDEISYLQFQRRLEEHLVEFTNKDINKMKPCFDKFKEFLQRLRHFEENKNSNYHHKSNEPDKPNNDDDNINTLQP